MKVILKSSDLGRLALENTVVTIGVFDGVHAGHLKVIRRLLEIKEESTAAGSVLVTFDRHPLSVTHPEMMPPFLTTLDEKLSLLRRLDIGIIFVEKFSVEIAGMDYGTYISERLIGDLGMKHLVVGYDFHLGRGRSGSQEQLLREGRRSGFGVTIVPPVVLSGRVVSSTKIRQAVIDGKLRQAARFLTRSYFFDADVVMGEGRGRGLDFPTANVAVSDRRKLLPSRGVYAVEVEAGGDCYGGMMNVGTAPTFRSGGEVRIEVHLFDFSSDLYGERIRIHCLKCIRKEKRFDDPRELQKQLSRDRREVKRILEKKR